MSVKFKRTISYTEGRDSTFTENAECLSEALDRELKFATGQLRNFKGLNKGNQIESIRIYPDDREY